MTDNSSIPSIITGVVGLLGDSYLTPESLDRIAEDMIGRPVTVAGNRVGKVLEAWVEKGDIRYTAEIYNSSEGSITDE